jgi:hypothetical protein
MIASVREARPEDIDAISANTRAADRRELFDGYRATPEECMRYGMRFGARTGLIDDEPVCMFGVVPHSILMRQGRPWMVGTEALDRLSVSKELLRFSRLEVAMMRSQYGALFNVVDDRNGSAKRWLKWLGFRFDEPFAHGPDGAPFRAFHWFEGEACTSWK